MDFNKEFKILAHDFIKDVYRVTKSFPRDELYGVTSQVRRASLSVMLNFIEGYAQRRGSDCKVFKNFIEISYGSLKESEYLLYFSFTENYITEIEYKTLLKKSDRIGRMLWGIISKLK